VRELDVELQARVLQVMVSLALKGVGQEHDLSFAERLAREAQAGGRSLEEIREAC